MSLSIFSTKRRNAVVQTQWERWVLLLMGFWHVLIVYTVSKVPLWSKSMCLVCLHRIKVKGITNLVSKPFLRFLDRKSYFYGFEIREFRPPLFQAVAEIPRRDNYSRLRVTSYTQDIFQRGAINFLRWPLKFYVFLSLLEPFSQNVSFITYIVVTVNVKNSDFQQPKLEDCRLKRRQLLISFSHCSWTVLFTREFYPYKWISTTFRHDEGTTML